MIYFHQQWVGDHSEEWFASRGPLARAVMAEMKAAGVHVCSGGLDEDLTTAVAFDPTADGVSVRQGRVVDEGEYLGGMVVVDVESEEQARAWAIKVAEACGWPQEMRRLV